MTSPRLPGGDGSTGPRSPRLSPVLWAARQASGAYETLAAGASRSCHDVAVYVGGSLPGGCRRSYTAPAGAFLGKTRDENIRNYSIAGPQAAWRPLHLRD